MLNKTNAIVPYIGIDIGKWKDEYVEVYYHYSFWKMDYYEINWIKYDVSKTN